MWRQLWRVCDRSDMIVQVVDGRNPLMFFTEDLKKYLTELKPTRPMLLLVNKSDLLSEYQRRQWAKHFRKLRVFFLFYSAHLAQAEIDVGNLQPSPTVSTTEVEELTEAFVQQWRTDTVQHAKSEAIRLRKLAEANQRKAAALAAESSKDVAKEEDEEEDEDEDEDEEEEEEEEEDELDGLEEVADDEHVVPPASTPAAATQDEEEATEEPEEIPLFVNEDLAARIFTRTDLLTILHTFSNRIKQLRQLLSPQELDAAAIAANRESRACVGMVGYPNVGKSSVINTLLGVAKSSHGKLRVAVSSTPGKTKHFQTLNLSETLVLCDCPGLVFPSFMRNAGEMLCSGILPINQMRDCYEPGDLIAARVPMHLLEAAYGIKIVRELDILDHPDRPPTGSEVLSAYCKVKTYITSSTGRWDEFRACKEVLRDFNDGVILYVAMPPEGCDVLQWLLETEHTMVQRSKVGDRLRARLLKQQQDQLLQTAPAQQHQQLPAQLQALHHLQLQQEAADLALHRQGVNLLAYSDYHLPAAHTATLQPTAEMRAQRRPGTGLGGVEDDEDEDDEEEYEDIEGDDEGGLDVEGLDEVEGEEGVTTTVVEYEFITEDDAQAFVQYVEENEDTVDPKVIAAARKAAALAAGVDLEAEGASSTKREHKRGKRWGKKSRKLRDKDPYREDLGPQSFTAYLKNRNPQVNASNFLLQGRK